LINLLYVYLNLRNTWSDTTESALSLKYFIRSCVYIFVLAAFFPASAQTEIPWIEQPSWVEELQIEDLPEHRRGQISDGVYYSLDEAHYRWDGNVRLLYSRLAMQVVSRAGLEKVGTISRDFDPNFTELSIIGIDILRDGKRFSVKDKIKPEVFRRETDLEKGIIDGTLTMHIDIPGLKVGDSVDLRFLYERDPRIGELNRYSYSYLEWAVPVGVQRITVDWDRDTELNFNVSKNDYKPTVTTLGDGTRRYQWLLKDVEPIYKEDDVPFKRDIWSALQFTGSQTWGPLVDAMRPFYKTEHEVPAEFLEDLSEISKEDYSDKTKAILALRLVQDQIRYVGLEVGAGGYFARPPKSVAQNGFGDCKDKSVLLRTLLMHLGVKAEVALVNNSQGDVLAELLPSPNAFNHMIVAAYVDDELLWLDPTFEYQGGTFDGFASPTYKYGLILDDGVRDLTPIEPSKGSVYKRKMTETFKFNKDGVDIDVVTKADGAYADWYRAKFERSDMIQYGQTLLEYYNAYYGGVQEIAPVSFKDNVEINRMVVREKYQVPTEDLNKPELFLEFGFNADAFKDRYSPPTSRERKYPLEISHPYHLKHVVSVFNAPIGFKPPEEILVENDYFTFRMKAVARINGIDIEWELETHRDSVAPEDFASWKADVKKMQDNSYYEWNLTPVVPETSGFLQDLWDSLTK